jgi:hypothetical protein
MADNKDDVIIQRLKEVANNLKYGTIMVEFKVHDGKISKGDIIEKKETLC